MGSELAATALAALLLAPAAAARDFLVAPGQSLVRAQLAARKTRGADTITLSAGTYVLPRPLRLDARDSDVTWRAAPDATVTISGGTAITRWRATPSGTWEAPAEGLRTRQLFVNGTRATRARGELPPLTMTATGYRASVQLPWRGAQDAELVWNVLWKQFRCGISGVHGDEITVRQPCFANAQAQREAAIGLPTRVENVPKVLDEPGEWYLDAHRDVVVYLPRPGEKLDAAAAVAPRLEAVLTARRVHDVTFEGITFADATWRGVSDSFGLVPFVDNFMVRGAASWSDYDKLAKMRAAVTISRAHNVAVTHCRFVRLGGAGLTVDGGTTDARVADNEFTDISGTAIQLGDVYDHHTTTPTARILVERNRIHDVAAEYEGGDGIWAGYVADTTIAHNELYDLPYDGISVGWGWGHDDATTAAGRNRVEANFVHDVMRVLHDGGGIYVNGAQPGTVVGRNVVVNNENWGGALYVDDGSSGDTVEGNVVFDTHRWPYMFKGERLTIRDNWWDYEMAWGWAFFLGGTVERNHLIGSLGEAPAQIVAAAGVPR